MLGIAKRYRSKTVTPARLVCQAACLLAGLACLAGCQRPPTADADDVIAYVRNGAVGARVRHLGPEVQPYVRDVFKAHGDWQNELAPMADLMDPDALWGKEDNTWHDPEAVSQRVEAIRNWRDQSKHEQRLDQLAQAIQKVPPTFAEDASRIASAAEKELMGSDPELMIQVAGQYETLLKLVQEAQADFEEHGKGLAFQDRKTIEAVHHAWDQLHQTLTEAKSQERERTQSTIQWMLGEGKRLRDEALENKRNTRQDLSDPREVQRMTRKLDIDIHYYDKMIQQAEQQEAELARAAGDAALGE